MTDWTLYCDESGNAGSNYRNRNQPFHVAGGVLIPNNEVGQLEQLAASYNTQGPELKGKNLVKSKAGRRKIRGLLDDAGDIGAKRFYIVYERWFSIAGKIVDLCFDPESNPSASWLPLRAAERREQLANAIFQTLSSSTLDEFAKAYKNPTQEALTAALHSILADLNSPGLGRVRQTIESAQEHLQKILANDKVEQHGLGHNIWAAINIPSLMYLIRRADAHLDDYNGHMEVIHDEIPRLGEAYTELISPMIASDSQNVATTTTGGQEWRLGLRNTDAFSLRSSEAVLGIQFADLVASTVRHLFSTLGSLDCWSRRTNQLAKLFLPALFDDHEPPRFAGAYVSDGVEEQLWGWAHENAVRTI